MYERLSNTYNNDPDEFNIFRSEARKKITKGVINVTEVPRAQITK